MTGKEMARLRTERGYTQGALARLLGVSTPTVSRMEAAAQVPAEHLEKLGQLPPAPASAGGRGAYRREQQTKPVRRQQRARTSRKVPPVPAPAHEDPDQVLSVEEASAVLLEEEEGVLSADQAGAVLLEESPWEWEQVIAFSALLLMRRARRGGGPPCR